MHDISVVIPVLNGADTISAQLDAVLAQEGVESFEVVVVDNGSTDRTVDVVRTYVGRDGRVRLLDGGGLPKGGAAAKNLGVQRARSELIAFCDADDVVRPGWLRGIRDALLADPVVVVTREYWSLNPHLSHRYQPRTGLEGTVFGVPSISGGAFGIRKALYETVGGFDESFLGAVDSEFSIRLMRAGYRAHPVASAEVSVRLPTSPGQYFRRRRLLARSVAEIHRRHAVRGDDYSLGAVVKTAGALVLRSYRLVRPANRFAWAARAGSLVGRLEVLTRRPPPRAAADGYGSP
ncbi:MAG: glycosyltransferase [Mycobacteriales bacterium]